MKTRLLNIARRLRARLSDEEGAVSADWVVLTAGIVGVAALAASTITDATSALSSSVKNGMSSKTVTNGD